MDKIKKILREGLLRESNDCDCCKYFDYSSLSNYGLDKPLYYLIEKWQKLELINIKPKQYIFNIARNFGGLSYEDAIEHINDDNVKKYAQAMENGDKFPIGHYTEGGSGQEGRHRALAAMRLGCETIPILKITKLNYEDVMEFIKNHRDYDREQMDRLFDNEVYKGVHNLGWQNFDRRRNDLNDE
jgi:poly(A) polymerase Pap1